MSVSMNWLTWENINTAFWAVLAWFWFMGLIYIIVRKDDER